MTTMEYQCPECGWRGRGDGWKDLCPCCSSMNVDNGIVDDSGDEPSGTFMVPTVCGIVAERRRNGQ